MRQNWHVVVEAEEQVKRELNNQEGSKDNTLAIVLGTLGGVLGVALIAGEGYMFYTKKYKKPKREVISLEELGDTNPTFTDED
ncbi:hypothetical protein Pmani_007395 [Petrolisthes manimaculis]|uniref:Uncharacterized protein n=1 Tax=Petrolisthes manimaculis TaxID=1843537 RepID=A0AAE1Q8C6_9EUCA|nr:hypothetical protein Pmani_007395 [Petrolisthes manimaculis]